MRLDFTQPISEIDDEEEAAKAVDEADAESTSSPTTGPSTPQDTPTTSTEPNTSY